MIFREGTLAEANPLLSAAHYLGPVGGAVRLVIVGERECEIVAAMVWKRPTSRRLPSDGSWLELSRWCLTPAAGKNAGSRMHAATVKLLRGRAISTLISYSDPSAGHTGALYRACNWRWAPTWHRLRPPPTGNGAWIARSPQAVKDRWYFELAPDPRRAELLAVQDESIVRKLGPGPYRWRDFFGGER